MRNVKLRKEETLRKDKDGTMQRTKWHYVKDKKDETKQRTRWNCGKDITRLFRELLKNKQHLKVACITHCATYFMILGNLHSGNIFIDNDVAKISDIENSIFGLASFYKPYLIENRRIQSLEDVDMYCFGHVLYEMAFGERLQSYYCDSIPLDCYNNLSKYCSKLAFINFCSHPITGAHLLIYFLRATFRINSLKFDETKVT